MLLYSVYVSNAIPLGIQGKVEPITMKSLHYKLN